MILLLLLKKSVAFLKNFLKGIANKRGININLRTVMKTCKKSSFTTFLKNKKKKSGIKNGAKMCVIIVNRTAKSVFPFDKSVIAEAATPVGTRASSIIALRVR